MRKPTSIPSDGNRRRLVTEPFTIRWMHKGHPHRMTIEPWGASYEPSVPQLPSWVHALGGGGTLAMILARLTPLEVASGVAFEAGSVLWALWALATAPALLVGVVAPREALSPVSAAHDYMYRRKGEVDYEMLVDGRWEPRSRMGRAKADAVMRADADDPAWLQWAAWAFVSCLGWWKWDEWDEWVSKKLPW